MLELRADSQAELLGQEADLILHKGAEDLIGATAGRKDNGRDGSGIARRQAVPEPHPNLLLPWDTEAMLHIDIECITRFTERRLTPVRAVVVELQAQIRRGTEDALPAPEEIPPGQVGIGLHGGPEGRRKGGQHGSLPGIPGVDVALHRHSIAVGPIPVQAKARLAHAPIIEVRPIAMEGGIAVEGLAVHAVEEVLADASAIAHAAEALLFRATARNEQTTLGLLRPLGNDVDHAVHRIRAPNGPPRPPDDLDTVDVFKQRVLHFPIDTSKQG